MKTKKAPEPFIPGKDYILEELEAFYPPQVSGNAYLESLEQQRKIAEDAGLQLDFEEIYSDFMEIRHEARRKAKETSNE